MRITPGERPFLDRNELERAAEIAEELGYLPLALEQAGAYIAERRLTFSGYLVDWRSRSDTVLKRFDPRVSNYPASVAVTWQTSVDRLSAPARRLLQRLAWLGPEPIPEFLLEIAVPGLPKQKNGASFPELLAELDAYSLVTRSPDHFEFSAHRLVQDVTRRSLNNRLRTQVLSEALAWVDTAFQVDTSDVSYWPRLDPLAAHARSVTGFADEAEIAHPTARLLNQLAVLFHTKSLTRDAEPLMRRALEIGEKSHGPEDPKVAARLSNLAQLLHNTNRLAEAEPLMRRALEIGEKRFGPEDPKVATRLNNLAVLLKDTNHLAEAEPLMRRALEIDETKLGPEDSNVARDLSNLALLLKDTNRLVEAEPLMRRALDIDEESFGPEHPSVARDLNSLALLLKDTNRLADAEPLMRRALDIDEKKFGSEHPNVATGLNNLALLLQATDRLAEAETLKRKALKLDEKSFGPRHPRVARDLNNLALLLGATNRLAEAEPLMRRALEISIDFQSQTGFEHPNHSSRLENYRAFLTEMGRSDEEIEKTLAELTLPTGRPGSLHL